MDNFFKISKRKSTIKTEIIAGITVFFSMSYILAINPLILSDAGMDPNAVFTATVISAIIGTLIMGLYANFPVAQAPGMGMNAFFAYTLVLTAGYSWQEALFVIFVSGLFFLTLSFSGIREKIINMIPSALKHGVSVGIGFFIAFVGLKNSGIIVANEATFVSLGNLSDIQVLLAIFGITLVIILLAAKVNGAIFYSMISVALLSIITSFISGSFVSPDSLIAIPPSLDPVFGQLFTVDIFSLLFSINFWLMVASVLFVDFFDTAGTLVTVGTRAGFVDGDGKLEGGSKAIFSDAIATTIGAIVGTSSVTSYTESTIGVEAGGRTGLTSVTVAFLFMLSLFFSPLLIFVTPAVVAPALMGVGMLMASSKKYIDFNNFSEASAVFVTIIMMILTYSIAEGLALGFITYTIAKIAAKESKDLDPLMYVLTSLFILRYLLIVFI